MLSRRLVDRLLGLLLLCGIRIIRSPGWIIPIHHRARGCPVIGAQRPRRERRCCIDLCQLDGRACRRTTILGMPGSAMDRLRRESLDRKCGLATMALGLVGFARIRLWKRKAYEDGQGWKGLCSSGLCRSMQSVAAVGRRAKGRRYQVREGAVGVEKQEAAAQCIDCATRTRECVEGRAAWG